MIWRRNWMKPSAPGHLRIGQQRRSVQEQYTNLGNSTTSMSRPSQRTEPATRAGPIGRPEKESDDLEGGPRGSADGVRRHLPALNRQSRKCLQCQQMKPVDSSPDERYEIATSQNLYPAVMNERQQAPRSGLAGQPGIPRLY